MPTPDLRPHGPIQPEQIQPEPADVAIVGAGPAGLTLAWKLAQSGLQVVLLDRDTEPGGVPRHSDHPGYGLRDLHRFMRGPAYARALTERARNAGALIHTEATVTSLNGTTLQVTAPSGRRDITARAIVLATGCREAPRSARLIPGSRPRGIFTTGWLQRAVHLEHQSIGTRAVIIGAEHVSYSAAVTLAEAGCATVAMVTQRRRADTFLAFQVAAGLRYRFPLLAQSTVIDVLGRTTLEAVHVQRADGSVQVIACDTLICTGDWRAENTLASSAGLLIGASGGPVIDTQFRTSQPGTFAIGNLLHPGATAQRCVQDAAYAAASVEHWLSAGDWPSGAQRLALGAGLSWCSVASLASSPSALPPSARPLRAQPTMAPILVEVKERIRRPVFQVTQGGDRVGQVRRPWAIPTRPTMLPPSLLTNIDPHGPEAILTVHGA